MAVMIDPAIQSQRRAPAAAKCRSASLSERHWEIEDLDLDSIERSRFARDWLSFRIAATASFIETASDLYARNLAQFFAGDEEIVAWLTSTWEPEELRHGAALRSYVEHLWPEFSWEQRFDAFLAEYSRTCTIPDLEPAGALELAARCIVEMGTSALYRALHGYAREPVLKNLGALIYADEVRHYKHFYRHFLRYHQRERQSRLEVARTLLRRLLATRGEDGLYAYRHVWDFAPTRKGFEGDYRSFGQELTMLIRVHAPPEMLTHMILKPLSLHPRVMNAAARMSGPLYRLWLSAQT
ncbi:MAG TPA: ferritin-like domain-containing protein [Casimicrobiaceae bacterium]|nr:ferritin-like domain-containing protein [Casimicrobiaceae bacterium]